MYGITLFSIDLKKKKKVFYYWKIYILFVKKWKCLDGGNNYMQTEVQ